MKFNLFLVLCLPVVLSLNLNFIKSTIKNVFLNMASKTSPECYQQLKEYAEDIRIDKNSWALRMLDATFKIPSGLLSGHMGELGDFTGCIKIKTVGNTSAIILGKYCLGSIKINLQKQKTRKSKFSPNNLKLMAAKYLSGVLTTGGQGVVWGLCLPNNCHANDANIIGNYAIQKLLGSEVSINFAEDFCQTMDNVHPKLSFGAKATISLLVSLIMLVFVASLWDIYQPDKCPLVVQFFSAYTNCYKIFTLNKYSQDQIPCIEGLKFFSMIWVIMGHQYNTLVKFSVTNAFELLSVLDSLSSMMIANATFASETFLVITGSLSTYYFMKSKKEKVHFNFFWVSLYRYLRLTIPFAIVVAVHGTLLNYLGSGARWPTIKTKLQKDCQDYWWSALLYIQNYINPSNMCVVQSWYLCVDMQLFIFTPFVLHFLWKRPKACIKILSFCIFFLTGLVFCTAWIYEVPVLATNLHRTSDPVANTAYFKTHIRACPWIIGIMFGLLIFKIKHNEIDLRLNKLWVLVGWIICLGTGLTCVFIGHETLRSEEYNKLANSLHFSLTKIVWSVDVCWVIFACITNNGGPINWFLSLPIYQIFNRISYSVFLVHWTVILVKTLKKNRIEEFSVFEMLYDFWGAFAYSCIFGFILTLISEAPLIKLQKIFISGKKKPE